ncbi:unnamed protein product [Nippostrongylus brasiliensis]|uniref:Transposase n=1 Tax=Nippostrongylus brasiliensis TaxID=27835 RepID=A0A0N4XWG9_NIPBR|nr:unnamed protein product [Nippostrongylus brasiliensis]
MVLTGVVRFGVKLIAVIRPRGEQGWQAHRKDARKMFGRIRGAAAADENNVSTLYTKVPSIVGPSACLGERMRPYAGAVYPAAIVK